MSWYWILLIIFGAIVLMGPIMLFFAKLNKIDPFVLDKVNLDEDNLTTDQERSLMTIVILRPLFFPLWIERKIIKQLIKTK